MEKLYMKFREELDNWEVLHPDSPSLEECIEEGERLGYKYRKCYIELHWFGILLLSDFWDIIVSSYSEEEMSSGYKEHFLTPQYREVYVSDVSVEFALENKEKRILVAELPWNPEYKYICVAEEREEFKISEEYTSNNWKYIAEIPKEELPKEEQAKEMTLSELEKELWYPIKIIK